MASVGANRDIDCPICFEEFQPPIRNLLCGHTFCEECLVELSRESNAAFVKCPTCRRKTRLGQQGIINLPRNWIAENLLQQTRGITDRNGASSSGQNVGTTSYELTQLKYLASKYINENNHEAAIHLLRILLDEMEGHHKIKPLINLSDCLLKTHQIKEARCLCKNLAAIINSLDFTNDEKSECLDSFDNLRRLILDLKSIDYETSIILNQCLYKLSKTLYDGKDRVIRLTTIAHVMTEIAEEMGQLFRINDFKNHLPFMEVILEEIQLTACDDLKFKCLQISLCLQMMGVCYIYTTLYSRSVDVNKQAIDLMKSIFGDNARKYQVYGWCHNNIGNAYKNKNEMVQAKRAYLQASQIFQTVTDWKNNEEKEKALSNTNYNLRLLRG